MQIVVCVKQVPDTGEVKIDKETNTLIREGVPAIINPFDTHAIAEAIKIKKEQGGTVTVVTMGPKQAEEALKESIALGVDQVRHLCDSAFAGSDTWATSVTLTAAIRKLEPIDLVICGRQAIDGDTAQVGPGTAELLSIPHVTNVRKIEVLEDGRSCRVERLTDDGYEVLEVQAPLLITVVREINQPKMPSLRGMMKAKKADIPIWGHRDLGLEPEEIGLQGSPTWVNKVFSPEAVQTEGEIFSGTTEENAEYLRDVLKKVKAF